jgi:hypothetical protein
MEISLKKSIEAVRMTLLDANVGNCQLTFDIDTGSTENLVFDFVSNQLSDVFKPIEGSSKVFGIDGNYKENPCVEAELSIGDKSFKVRFNAVNADQTVINLQNDYGFQLHGILGIPFLVDNHCVINFNNKTITIEENE